MAVLKGLQALGSEVASSTYLVLGFYPKAEILNKYFKFDKQIPVIIPMGSAINEFIMLDNIKQTIGTKEIVEQSTEYIDGAVPTTFEYEVISKQIELSIMVRNPKVLNFRNIQQTAKDTLNIALINLLNGYLEKLVQLNGRITGVTKEKTEKELKEELEKELQNKLISVVDIRLLAFNLLIKNVSISYKNSDELIIYNLTLENITTERKKDTRSISQKILTKG